MIVLTAALLAPLGLSAGPREGVMEEFRAVEEAIRKRLSNTSPEAMKRTLENTIFRMFLKKILLQHKITTHKPLNVFIFSHQRLRIRGHLW